VELESPHESPRLINNASMAQKGGVVLSYEYVAPFCEKVFEALMLTRMQDGKSAKFTEMPATLKLETDE